MFNINRNIYEKTMSFFKKNKGCTQILKIIYKYLPLLVFVGYPLLIVYVFLNRSDDFFKVVLVPLGVFLFVTALRKLINRQRPYEKYKIESVFNKTTKGQSLPSRHTASAFVIAMTFLYVNLYIGIATLIIACLIGLSRILAGVHYIVDVLCGAGISIVFAIIFLFLI